MIRSLGWATFLLWSLFDVAIAALAFVFLQETKGLSLEAIAHQQFSRGGIEAVGDFNKQQAGSKADDDGPGS